MTDLLFRAIAHQGAGNLRAAANLYRSLSPDARLALAQHSPDGEWIYGPDFLIIGAARSGTTWLKKRLSEVAQVRVQAGEPNYFSMRSNLDPRTYIAELIAGAKNAGLSHFGERRIYGEKSPSYLLMSDDQIALAHALFPSARVIVMARNPIDRAWSHLRARQIDPQNLQHLQHHLRDGRLQHHIRRWAQYFPPAQIHICSYDDVCADPQKAFSDVLAFLGVSDAQPHTAFPQPPAIPPIPPKLRDTLLEECSGDIWEVQSLREIAHEAWADGRLAEAERRV